MKALEQFGKKILELEEENNCHINQDNKADEPDEAEVLLGKREPKTSGYYVCQNLWVFLSHPPCVMCSMALTHSRIEKLFYLTNGQSS